MKKLQRVVVSKEGGLETSRLPNNEETVAKVNEIVDWINKYESIISEVKEERDLNEIKESFGN